MSEPVLSVSDLTKEYGGLIAVDDVDLAVERGSLLGIVGPNGAGKTTLFNCVSGVESPTGGTVRFEGKDVTDAEAHELAREGLVRTFQLTRELTTMTVVDNVRLAAPDHPGERPLAAIVGTDAMRDRETAVDERARELLSRFELGDHAEEYSANLSGGQRKLLELARALMLDPDVLLLDEPFAGVNPTLTEDILDHLRRLNDEGVTVVVIEHDIETLTDLVEELAVFSQGALLTRGDPDTVLSDDRVIDAYLGE